MGYQKPRADHPWKTGRMPGEPITKKVKSFKVLLREISDGYENIEVYTVCYGREGRFRLWELSDSKQAAWFTGILKRNYT